MKIGSINCVETLRDFLEVNTVGSGDRTSVWIDMEVEGETLTIKLDNTTRLELARILLSFQLDENTHLIEEETRGGV